MAGPKKTKPTREQALEVARYLGCRGAHQREDGTWVPCATEETLQQISNQAETRTRSPLYKDGKRKRRKRKGWEHLLEGGVIGIDTLPSGGLVSAPISSKSMLGVSRNVRRGDPDVFDNPDSARARSRQLGCIGIRRYNAVGSGEAWMPCTNESDYRRRTGIGPQAQRDRRRSEQQLVQRVVNRIKKKTEDWNSVRGIPVDAEVKSRRKARRDRLAATPAKPSERISGSQINQRNSAANISSAADIELSDATVRGLVSKVRNHNARMRELDKKDWSQTNLGALKAVWRRGAGAFSISHRPGMTRQQWAMARVNAFLKMLENGKPTNLRYIGDVDLLPDGHPWKKKVKSEGFLSTLENKAARRMRGIAQSFDPEAVDGDNDGLVQDGSPFERPARPSSPTGLVRPLQARVTTPTKLRETRIRRTDPADRIEELGLTDMPSMLWSPDQSTAEAFGKGRGSGFVKERVQQVHRRILDALKGEVKVRNTQGNRRAIIIGGPVAIGKSTLRTTYGQQLGIPGRDGALHLDPDEIRELIPEHRDWILNPQVNASELTHAESMHLVQEGVKEAIAANMDVVHDTTGRDFRDVLTNLDAAGYSKIAHFATGDLKKAIEQSAERARLTGRWREPSDIKRSFNSMPGVIQGHIAADTFDEFYLWDTSSRPPVLVAKKAKGSPLQILEKKAWDKMLNGGV